MRPDEIRDAGAFVGTVAGGVPGLAAGLHAAIADRAFGAVGPAGGPVRTVHDRVADVVYGGCQRLFALAPRWLGEVAAVAGDEARPIDASPRGSLALGVLNGMYGDHLAERAPSLAIGMAVRHEGADLDLAPSELAAAFPRASPHVAVFVHGLCEYDRSWRPSPGDPDQVDIGRELADHSGCTPVYLRYNTGRHVSDNGEALDALLEALVAAWPVTVEEVSLIGHSMGGLVARSACHHADERGAEWAGRVRRVVSLGTPHLGAPLEQGANALAHVLSRVPETRGVAQVLNTRSVGIKDLRFGSIRREDWHGVDIDEFLTDRCLEAPFLSHADYYFVGATITRDARHPLGVVAGDLLVQFGSASGSGPRRELPFEIHRGRHLGGLNHFDLLTHRDVAAQLVEWFAVAPLPAGSDAP